MNKILLENIRYFTIFNELKNVKAGDIVEIQILRAGERDHPDHGPFIVNSADILEMKRNFDNKVRGIDIAVDENHESDHKALGRYKELYTKNKDTELRAKIELTELGASILSDGAYKYFSPEICWVRYDEERGISYENVLIGGGFTNRPFFKEMSGIIASESAGRKDNSDIQTFYFNEITRMNKLKKLLEGLKDKKIASFNEKFAVLTAFNELPEAEKAEVQTQVDEVTARPETEPTVPATAPEKKEGEAEGDEGEGEGKDKPSPTESAEFKEVIAKNKELELRLNKKETEELFSEKFAFSEKNTKGLFNEQTQKEAFVKFHLSLNEEQKKQFKELIDGIDPKLQLAFKELGNGGTANSSTDMVSAIKKIQAEKGIDYEEATKIYRELNK